MSDKPQGTPASELVLDTPAIFTMCMSLHSRLDLLWQRLLYAHAAIIGVMVFFSTSPEPYLMSRLLVFLFYSVNLLVSVVAMAECFRGLQAGLADLRAKSPGPNGHSHIETWLITLNYSAHPGRRIAIFATVWLLTGYLLFARFLPNAPWL